MAPGRNGSDAGPAAGATTTGAAAWATPGPRPSPVRWLTAIGPDLVQARRARWRRAPVSDAAAPRPGAGALPALREWGHTHLTRAWSAAGVELAVSGVADLDPDDALVLVANHQHRRDADLVRAALPAALARRVRVLGAGTTRALTRLPRPGRGRGVLLVFADGAPSSDGTVGRFDPAVVALARRRRARLVPVAVRGSFVLPVRRPWLPVVPEPTAPRVAVRFGTPRPAGAGTAEAEADRLREAVLELLAEDAGTWWQQRRGAVPPPSPGTGWRQVWAATAPTPEGGGRPRRRIWR